jgi:hypothetical protein
VQEVVPPVAGEAEELVVADAAGTRVAETLLRISARIYT